MTQESRLHFVAATDDFLLEEGIKAAIVAVAAQLDGVDPEEMSDEMTPEGLAFELCSPSLFSPQRLMIVRDVRSWIDTTTPRGAQVLKEEVDITSLLNSLESGIPDDMGLVIGAWCGRKPKGELVDLVSKFGQFQWLPAPPPPKPWEDIVLSNEQIQVLRRILQDAIGNNPIDNKAERLLIERLGFKPRLLAQEVSKLAIAAAGKTIDEELVRSLMLTRERSIEVVRDSLLKRDFAPIFDLIAASAAGHPVVDYSGKTMDSGGITPMVLSTVFNLLHQFLFLRRAAVACGFEKDIEAKGPGRHRFNSALAKKTIVPAIEKRMKKDLPYPKSKKGKVPSAWSLGQLLAGASLYTDQQLIHALAEAGEFEAQARGKLDLDNLSAWLSNLAYSSNQ